MSGAAEPADAGEFDARWYEAAYPAVRVDLAQGRAVDAWDHYRTLGRHRGYLPHRMSERPPNPIAYRSAFGGLWTDQSNALDLIEGKLALGWISEAEAHQLRRWIEDGFVVLPQAVSDELIEPALRDLQRAFDGEVEGQQFVVEGRPGRFGWAPFVREEAAKAIDVHDRSLALQNLSFAPAILRFLALIFERPALATQSLGFLRGSAQEAHQDSRVVAYTAALQFAASWIALEDVTPGAGELFYYVGSHRLPDYLYAGRHKNQYDAQRLEPARDIEAEAAGHDRDLHRRSREMGLRAETLQVKRGDVMIWSGDLAHGGRPISNTATRRSLVTHYCPQDIAPLSCERRRREVRRHPSGAAFLVEAG